MFVNICLFTNSMNALVEKEESQKVNKKRSTCSRIRIKIDQNAKVAQVDHNNDQN